MLTSIPDHLEAAFDLAERMERRLDAGERSLADADIDDLVQVLDELPLPFLPGRMMESRYRAGILPKNEMSLETAEAHSEALSNIRMTLERSIRLLMLENVRPASGPGKDGQRDVAEGPGTLYTLSVPSSLDECVAMDAADRHPWPLETWELERRNEMTSITGVLKNDRVRAFLARELQPQTSGSLASLILKTGTDPGDPQAVEPLLQDLLRHATYPVRAAVDARRDDVIALLQKNGVHFVGTSADHYRTKKGLAGAYLFETGQKK